MLEICFNDSVKCALSLAQNCGRDIIGGAVGVITNKKGLLSCYAKRKAIKEYRKRQMELQKIAVPLGGKREDIVGISFGLSEGDIKSPICLEDCPRKEYIREVYSFDRYNEQTDTETAINEFWTNCISDLQKLKSNPLQIRVWLDSTPDAQCGLLFLADLLKGGKTAIHVVELPQKITGKDNCTVEYRGWGEVEPQLFGTFLNKERVLTENEVKDLADKWQVLKNENSLLRVIKNGSVISADISYYDDLIRKEFPKEACKIANIIGGALGNQEILTGDVFIAKRIQNFIKNGELVVLDETDKMFYSTTVTCSK